MRETTVLRYVCLMVGWLLAMLPAAARQPTAELDSLTKEMYRLWPKTNEPEAFMRVTDQLKAAAQRAGDSQLFWRAWSNQSTFIFRKDRERGMAIAKEMTAYAKAHDDKYGLYISTYTNASHASTLRMEDQAERLFKESISYKERFLPTINAAADYLGLAKIYVNRRQADKIEEVCAKALQQPNLVDAQRVSAWAYRCYAPMIHLDAKKNTEKWLKQFYDYYAEMDKVRQETGYTSTLNQIIDIYKAQYDKDYEKMLELSRNLKNPQERLSMIAHTYTHMGKWEDAFFTLMKYKKQSDSLNSEQIRRQSSEHSLALDAARSETEAKDLRIANQQLELAHLNDELEQRRLQEEALQLSLKNQTIELQNREMELQNATVRQKNDSLDKYNKDLQISEYQSKAEAQASRERTQRIQLWSAIGIGLLTICFMAIYLHRRNRHAKEIETAYDKLETAHGQLEKAYGKLEETTKAKERIESELRIARVIQMGMVPRIFPAFPDREDIDIFASIDSAKEVGGDLYDFFLQSEHLYFCIGDVSGKGIPASLFMSVVVNLFRMVAKEGFPPEYIATRLNETLAEDNNNGMFCTMFIGDIDLRTGYMNFCNAGHNPPLVVDRPLSPLEPCRPAFIEMEANAPIGLWPGLEYVGESVKSVRGRQLFLYTDGLSEAENISHEQFGEERLINLFCTRPYKDAHQTVDIVESAVRAFVGEAEQSDDLTMLCIKIR